MKRADTTSNPDFLARYELKLTMYIYLCTIERAVNETKGVIEIVEAIRLVFSARGSETPDMDQR